MKTVREQILELVSEQLGTPDVTDATRFYEDCGADSLDQIELIIAAESIFGIEIPDEDAEKLLTVGDAVKYIEANITK